MIKSKLIDLIARNERIKEMPLNGIIGTLGVHMTTSLTPDKQFRVMKGKLMVANINECQART